MFQNSTKPFVSLSDLWGALTLVVFIGLIVTLAFGTTTVAPIDGLTISSVPNQPIAQPL